MLKNRFGHSQFEDNEDVSDIMNQLDMENIHLSNEMFGKLSKILN